MRIRTLSLFLAGLVAVGLCAPVTAGAAPVSDKAAPGPDQAAPSPDQATKAKARAYFAKGGQHYAKERYAQAIIEFQKAYTFWKNPRILLNIAICYSEMSNAVKAVIYLRRALKTADAEQLAKLKTKIPAGLQARPSQVADLKVVMPDGAAEIFINDEPAGSSPVERVVAPGAVRVVVKLDGKVKVSKTLTLAAGEKKTFALSQWPAATPSEGGVSWRTRLKRLAKLPVYYVGAAALVTLVGTAVLIGTGVRTEQIQDDYYGTPTLDTRDQGIRLRTTTNVFIGITVTAGLAAVALAVFTDWSRLPWKKEKPASTRILPSVGPGGLGLTATGRF
jgi:hypothetical protein